MLLYVRYSQSEEGGSSQSSHRVAALASALADKMLESPEMVKLLEGDLSSTKTKKDVTPKSVFKASSSQELVLLRVVCVCLFLC